MAAISHAHITPCNKFINSEVHTLGLGHGHARITRQPRQLKNTFQRNAAQFADAFELDYRHAGTSTEESFFKLKDGCPDWMTKAVHDAHDDELPNDWRFEICAQITEWLVENDFEDADKATDESLDFASDAADQITPDLLFWLKDVGCRYQYCDQFIEDNGKDSYETFLDLVTAGQTLAIESMVQDLANACKNFKPEPVLPKI